MPVKKGNLRKEGKEKIRRNYKFLLDELEGKDLVDDLIQANIFDFDDKEEICHQVSRKERAEIFLQKLLRSGPYQAYDVFLQTLRKEYPHVAETLDKTQVEDNGGQLQEIYDSTHTNKDIAERKAIIKKLQEEPFLEMISLYPYGIPTPSFNMRHLPEGFKHKEVLDCVHSLAQQTVLAVDQRIVSDRLFRPFIIPGTSGRVWRVERKFSTADNKSCPCNECEGSNIPRKQWGEYIVLSHSYLSRYYYVERDKIRFVLGYDSVKNLSDVSVLKAVSVIRCDESLGFAEVVCITHDADTSKKVEDICHRNIVNREKLLNSCHLLQKDKKLAVSVSHPDWGPKHISVGEWLEDKWDQTSGCSRHVFTGVYGTGRGSPVLIVDSGNASVTLNYDWDDKKEIKKSCGYVWSL